MDILSIEQEKYHFLDMCNLCRYARFSQAQSHIHIIRITLYYQYTKQQVSDHSKSAAVHWQGVVDISRSYCLPFQQHTLARRRSIILVSPNKHCWFPVRYTKKVCIFHYIISSFCTKPPHLRDITFKTYILSVLISALVNVHWFVSFK